MSTPQQTPGGQREDTALAVGAAVSAVMTSAQLLLLSALGESVRRLLHGGIRRTVARNLHATTAATMGGASLRVERILAAAQRRILGETTAVLNESLPSPRTVFGVAVDEPAGRFAVPEVPVSSEWGRFLDRVRQAAAVAVAEVDGAFHRAAVAATGAEPTVAAQAVLDDLSAHGITVFTDATGRRWELPVYSQMAARTASTRLALATQYHLMGQHDMDLVVVDKTSAAEGCPKCVPFEYRVLSLFGRTPAGAMVTAVDSRGVRHLQPVMTTLTAAVARGLLHPSCRHFMVPFADGMSLLTPPSVATHSYRSQQLQRGLERAVRRELAGRAVALSPLSKAQANRRLRAARSNLDAHVRKYDHHGERFSGKAG